MAVKTDRIIKRLQADNPGLEVRERPGDRHKKLFLNGKLIGILPKTLLKEGLSRNLVSQLRRAGLTVRL